MKSNTNWAISFTFANDFGGAVVVGRSRDESNGSKIINAVLTISLDSNCKFIHTAQKMKFSMKDFFSKCDQIRKKLRIWSHLRKKSLMKNFICCAVSSLAWVATYLEKIVRSITYVFLFSSIMQFNQKFHLTS